MYAPITTKDNATLLLENLNNSNTVTYQGGPDQYNPIGYTTSTLGTQLLPFPPGSVLPTLQQHNPQPLYNATGGLIPLNGFRLPRTQFDQVWYLRPISGPGGKTSRRSKVIRVRYPQTPQPPTVISINSNYMQFDFDGDIRSIYGFELRAADNNTILVQKPIASYADLNIDLTQTGNAWLGTLTSTPWGIVPAGQNRNFYAYFFNHQWSYSLATEVYVTPPKAPVIEEGYRFGQSLDIISDLDSRLDIAAQTCEIWTSSGSVHHSIGGDFYLPPPASAMIASSRLNYQTQNWTANVPADSDLFVRSVRWDLISSGSMSNWLHIPQGDLLASDYLTSQGSVPPFITIGQGGLFTYDSSNTEIIVNSRPFDLMFPNGTMQHMPVVNGDYTATLDTLAPLSPTGAAGYLFYFRCTSPAFQNPAVIIDGPYAAASSGALIRQTADGSIPLSNGPLTAHMASAASGLIGIIKPIHGGSGYSATAQAAIVPAPTGGGYDFLYVQCDQYLPPIVYDNVYGPSMPQSSGAVQGVYFVKLVSWVVTYPPEDDRPDETYYEYALYASDPGGSIYTSPPAVNITDSGGGGAGASVYAVLTSGNGSGGGSFGGGNCGVLSSLVTLANEKKITLEQLTVGELLKSKERPEEVVSKTVVLNEEVWTLTTKSGKTTRVGLAHTFKTEHGYMALCELLDDLQHESPLPLLQTVDGLEEIASIDDRGESAICHIALSGPSHLYVLDGLWNHNTLFKG